MRGLARGLLVFVVLVGLAGCGEPQDVPGGSGSPEPGLSPPSSRSASPSGPPSSPVSRKSVSVTVHRTGGYAGVDHRLEIAPNGTWAYHGDGKRESGKLTSSQVDMLRELATDDRLPAEAKHRDKRTCNDGYTYDITVDSFSLTAVECGRFEERPALNELVGFLKGVTPL